MEEKPAAPEDASKPAILVVEDNAVYRKSYQHLFSSAPYFQAYRLVCRDTAWLGLQWLQLAPDGDLPKAILLDWVMEGMDGMDFLRAVKAEERLKAIPVLMVTSNRERSEVARACAMGVRDYLIKPIQPPVLEKKLQKILGPA